MSTPGQDDGEDIAVNLSAGGELDGGGGVQAWAASVHRWAVQWDISAATEDAVTRRLVRGPVIPPFTGLSHEAVKELVGLPLSSLGQLRDIARPDLYPPDRAHPAR